MTKASDVIGALTGLHTSIAKALDDAPTGVTPGFNARVGGTVMPNGKLRYVATGINATYANPNSSVSISNNTTTAVSLDAELFDGLNAHDNAVNPSRITIPADGLYAVVAQAAWAANATGRRECKITSVTGAGTLTRAGSVIQASPTGATYQGCYTIESCVAGDYYRMDVLQTSGGALNLSGGDGASFLIVARIG